MKRPALAQSCCTTPSAIWFCTAMFLLLYGGGLLLGIVWPAVRQYGDTLILAALGAACFINFGRNRTLHCGLTGPLFLVGAVVAALVEARIWNLDLDVVWGVVLAGVAMALFIEWRTVGRQSGASRA